MESDLTHVADEEQIIRVARAVVVAGYCLLAAAGWRISSVFVLLCIVDAFVPSKILTVAILRYVAILLPLGHSC